MEALKKETAAQKATTSADTEIVAVSSVKVKLDAYMTEKNIDGVVLSNELRRRGFTVCNKSTISMARNPEKYGVELTADARRCTYQAFGEPSELIRRRKAKRNKPNRLVLYLSNVDYEAFLTVKPLGMTNQEFLYGIVMEEVEARRAEAYGK